MSSAVEVFAAALQQFKERRGHSYNALERSTGISRSALQRYCSGGGVPTSGEAVERIARACGAHGEEFRELYRLWVLADAERADTTPGAPSESPVTPPQVLPDAAPDVPATVPDLPGRPAREVRLPRRARISTRTSLVVLLGVVVVAGALLPVVRPGLDGASVIVPAPAPGDSPSPEEPVEDGTLVDPSFFGVTISSRTGRMPGFRVGAVRLWESRTRWDNIEPQPGQSDWSTLDRLVDGAQSAGLPVLFTSGGTPGWASPGGRRTLYQDDSRASPPDDLGHWDRFVTTLAQRYQGRIEAYEVWDNVSGTNFWDGDWATLAELTRRADVAIAAVDPEALVVCPSFHGPWTESTRSAITAFTAAGGYEHCDAAGVKLDAQNRAANPEAYAVGAEQFTAVLQDAGVQLPLWDTGVPFHTDNTDPYTAQQAAAYAARLYLTGLAAGVERMYFYAWGGRSNIHVVLQVDGEPPLQAGEHVGRLQEWLAEVRLAGCSHGPDDGTPGGAWQCRIIRPDTGGTGEHEAVIRWASTGIIDVAAQDTDCTVRHLNDAVAVLPAGQELRLTEQPVLVECTSP